MQLVSAGHITYQHVTQGYSNLPHTEARADCGDVLFDLSKALLCWDNGSCSAYITKQSQIVVSMQKQPPQLPSCSPAQHLALAAANTHTSRTHSPTTSPAS
jgi:hypothetical protein